MKPRTHKRLLKAWPLCCGLVIFGVFAVAMGSETLVVPALFGGIGWGVFHALTASGIFGPWAHANAAGASYGRKDTVFDEDEQRQYFMDNNTDFDPHRSSMAGNIYAYTSPLEDD